MANLGEMNGVVDGVSGVEPVTKIQANLDPTGHQTRVRLFQVLAGRSANPDEEGLSIEARWSAQLAEDIEWLQNLPDAKNDATYGLALEDAA